MLGGNLAMDQHHIQGGSSNIPGHYMLQKLELSASLMGLLARTVVGRFNFFITYLCLSIYDITYDVKDCCLTG